MTGPWQPPGFQFMSSPNDKLAGGVKNRNRKEKSKRKSLRAGPNCQSQVNDPRPAIGDHMAADAPAAGGPATPDASRCRPEILTARRAAPTAATLSARQESLCAERICRRRACRRRTQPLLLFLVQSRMRRYAEGTPWQHSDAQFPTPIRHAHRMRVDNRCVRYAAAGPGECVHCGVPDPVVRAQRAKVYGVHVLLG